MLVGDSVVLWQFHAVRLQQQRVDGLDQELVAVLRVHASLLALYDRLEALANFQDAGRLVVEAGSSNKVILEETRRARSVLHVLPTSVDLDPAILSTLEIIQRTLESQLDEITDLAKLGDWTAVRLRLANQVHPIEFSTSALVEKVDHQVSEEQAQVAQNIRQVERRVFVVVPASVLFTLLIAGTLGLAITRSITRPLERLVEGSRMIARGEFHFQVSVEGEDELARLGQVFNDAARHLQDLYTSLQNSEDRLRRVINTIPAHVWSARPDGSIDFVNQRLLDATGLSAEVMLGAGWRSIIHPEDIARYLGEWQVALTTGEPMDSEVRVRTALQDYQWMLIRNVPLRDGQGETTKWYGTGVEIEDRKRTEEQLRRSEAYLAEAQHLTHTGSFGWQVSTGEIRWSEETFQIFGYDTASKPSLETIVRRTHPDDKEPLRQLLEQVSSEGESFDTEHRLLMPDGGVKHLHVVAHLTSSLSGIPEFIGAVTDISAAKHAEEELRKAHADLAHVNRVTAMGELSASLAHEISQPISGALMNGSTCVRMLKREYPDIEKAGEAASRMVRDINRAEEIISRIRQFFKKGTLKKEPVNVNEIIEEMVSLLRNEASRYSVTVQTGLAGEIPPVLADRVQIQQVLMNLMINGIDAMKNVDGPRQLTIQSKRSENQRLLVSVDDTGIGLPPQFADKIFTAFFTTKDHGTGMGLRISRNIIEAHGGVLWATDRDPRGASLYFTLSTLTSGQERQRLTLPDNIQ